MWPMKKRSISNLRRGTIPSSLISERQPFIRRENGNGNSYDSDGRTITHSAHGGLQLRPVLHWLDRHFRSWGRSGAALEHLQPDNCDPKTSGVWPGLVQGLANQCLATGVPTCPNDSCGVLRASLRNIAPRCPSWNELREWVLAVVACYLDDPSADHAWPAQRLIKHALFGILDCDELRPIRHGTLLGGRKYLDLEKTVRIPEVLRLFSWVLTVYGKRYECLYPLADRAGTEIEWSSEVQNAIGRIQKFGLCPHRISAISRTLSGGSINLAVLVPPRNPWPHVSKRNTHAECSFDFCEQSIRSFTSVASRHECSKHTLCTTKDFSQETLIHGINSRVGTAWRLDGLSLCPAGRYMAISHVWADGTGTGGRPHGTVNMCLYDFFCAKAAELHCDGIWWDSISLPADMSARCNAINNMHLNYKNAKVTLVHDCFLRELEWVDAESAAFAILMSPWFSRGWTALELAKSRTVKILFKGGVLKDLKTEILAANRLLVSPLHQLATTAITDLITINPLDQPPTTAITGLTTINSVDQLLTSLGPRYTSWPKDKAIIAGLLVGIEQFASKNQHEIYRNILCKIGWISFTNLFHESTTMLTPGFTWCPTDIFKMPLTTGHSERINQLTINDNGDIVGRWRVCSLKECGDVGYTWDTTDPIVRPVLLMALRNTGNHVLLVPQDRDLARKGLLVRIVEGRYGYRGSQELCARLVGFVSFRDISKTSKMPVMTVRIGAMAGMAELPTDQNISHYIRNCWMHQQKDSTVLEAQGGLVPGSHRVATWGRGSSSTNSRRFFVSLALSAVSLSVICFLIVARSE